MNKIGHITNGIIKAAGILMLALAILIYSFLTYNSFVSSMIAPTTYIPYNWAFPIPDSLLKNILYCGAGLAVLVFLYALDRKYPAKAARFEKMIFVCVMAAYIIGGIAFSLTNPYYPSGDQINTTAGAMYALEGNYEMFRPLGYIDICPHQKGLMFFYEICFRLFGPLDYTPVRIVTVFMNALTILMGYRLIKDLGGREFSGVLYTVLIATCVPYFWMIPYAYGDLPSIFGIMVMFRFFIRYMNGGSILNVLMTAAGAAFAILNRSAAWIAVVALIITAVFLTLKKGKLYPFACALFVALISYLALTAINIRYEKLSGYDRHTGSPVTAYIAMGMQVSDGCPGVYNRYHQDLYEKYNGNREAASEEAKLYISNRLEEFKEDPHMAYEFYKSKLLFQWNDPLFECNTHMYSFREGTVLNGFYESLYKGKLHEYIFKFMNRYQAFIYLLCLIAAIRDLIVIIKEDKGYIYGWFFHIFLIGGILFSLIWEAKARYSLPYFVFLIPVAAMLFTPRKENRF